MQIVKHRGFARLTRGQYRFYGKNSLVTIRGEALTPTKICIEKIEHLL